MEKIKISAISYLNTIPFIYGLQHSSIKSKIELSFDVPSTCANKMLTKTADLGIIPVAAIPSLDSFHIVGDYCIGAINNVRTVSLLSNYELDKIENIYLDTDSRTSALLVQVLSHNFWHIKPNFKPIKDINPQEKNSGFMLIGDKVFDFEDVFKYNLDLANQWYKYKNLPFVFATWTATKELSNDFIAEFNEALKFGTNHIEDAVLENNKFKNNLAIDYLQNNISYNFDELKRKGLTTFFDCAFPKLKHNFLNL